MWGIINLKTEEIYTPRYKNQEDAWSAKYMFAAVNGLCPNKLDVVNMYRYTQGKQK